MGLSAEVVVLSIVFPVLSIVAVALRLYSRRLKKLRLQADDYIIIPALVRFTLWMIQNHLGTALIETQALVVGMGIDGIIGKLSLRACFRSICSSYGSDL